MTTHLPKQMTLLSLNKKEILQLPGFEHLKEYLLKELKTFLREFINRHSSKKRGMTVEIYLQKYSQEPKPYQPSHPTQRKKRARKQTSNIAPPVKSKRVFKQNNDKPAAVPVSTDTPPPPSNIAPPVKSKTLFTKAKDKPANSNHTMPTLANILN